MAIWPRYRDLIDSDLPVTWPVLLVGYGLGSVSEDDVRDHAASRLHIPDERDTAFRVFDDEPRGSALADAAYREAQSEADWLAAHRLWNVLYVRLWLRKNETVPPPERFAGHWESLFDLPSDVPFPDVAASLRPVMHTHDPDLGRDDDGFSDRYRRVIARVRAWMEAESAEVVPIVAGEDGRSEPMRL